MLLPPSLRYETTSPRNLIRSPCSGIPPIFLNWRLRNQRCPTNTDSPIGVGVTMRFTRRMVSRSRLRSCLRNSLTRPDTVTRLPSRSLRSSLLRITVSLTFSTPKLHPLYSVGRTRKLSPLLSSPTPAKTWGFCFHSGFPRFVYPPLSAFLFL